MKRLSSWPLFRAIPAIACLAGILASSTPALAAVPRTESLLTSLKRAADSSLPAVAARGTGTNGSFNARALDAAAVSVSMPDGRVLKAVRQQSTEFKSKARKSWVGKFTDEPGSMIAISTVRGVTTGFITFGTETWEIMPRKSGKHVMYRVDDRKLSTVELEVSQSKKSVDQDPASTTANDYGLGTTTAAAGGSVVDLLVVYTPKARAVSGQAALASMTENAVAMANQAYQNSNINITLNLVGLEEISYSETGNIRTSLDTLVATNDGRMDSVHQLRNTVGADVVTLFTEDSTTCGIAHVMDEPVNAFAAEAFNVVKPGCLSQHSLAHEIGHNMGNRHDRESTSETGAYPYSYGFRRCTSDGTGFRTVMAYSCTGGKRVAWFSNPNVDYNGYPTGIAYESSPSRSADNARSMNNTAATVAGFRATRSGSILPPPSPPASPGALTATAASSSAINLSWDDNSNNETGFIVQRSTNGVDFTQVATLGAGSASYSSNGLAPATIYYHRVRAYNSEGNSGYSNVASVRTGSTTSTSPVPTKPASLSAVNRTDGSANVTWTDSSSNEAYFEVRRLKQDPVTLTWGSRVIVAKVNANNTSVVDVAGVGNYRYSVRAVNSAGASLYEGPATVKVTNR